MEKTYALALWKMLEAGKKPKEAVHALHEILVAKGRAALMPRVAVAFERLAEREYAKNALTLSVAHEKDEHSARAAIKGTLKELGAKFSDVDVQVDDSLIGGWRLEGRERLFDASFKNYLLSLYNRATQ